MLKALNTITSAFIARVVCNQILLNSRKKEEFSISFRNLLVSLNSLHSYVDLDKKSGSYNSGCCTQMKILNKTVKVGLYHRVSKDIRNKGHFLKSIITNPLLTSFGSPNKSSKYIFFQVFQELLLESQISRKC